MSVVIENITSAEQVDKLVTPTRQDGNFYRYEMICRGGWARVYADSIEDLLEYLVPGYKSMPEEEKLQARITHALDMQVELQSQINLVYGAYNRTPAEDIILNAPRHTPPIVDIWVSEVPLVLIDAFYMPYSDIPAPISGMGDTEYSENVWWLNPAENEFEYLRSLHESSMILLNIRKDEAV